jgi:hypothetical protein
MVVSAGLERWFVTSRTLSRALDTKRHHMLRGVTC